MNTFFEPIDHSQGISVKDTLYVLPYFCISDWNVESKREKSRRNAHKTINRALSYSPVYSDKKGNNKRVLVKGELSILSISSLPEANRRVISNFYGWLKEDATIAVFEKIDVCNPFSQFGETPYLLPKRPALWPVESDTVHLLVRGYYQRKELERWERQNRSGFVVDSWGGGHMSLSFRRFDAESESIDTLFVEYPENIAIDDLDSDYLTEIYDYLYSLLANSPLYKKRSLVFRSLEMTAGIRYIRAREIECDTELFRLMFNCGIPKKEKENLLKRDVVFALITDVFEADPYHCKDKEELWYPRY